jgi:predicted alpha/beta superfamily hydrolase
MTISTAEWQDYESVTTPGNHTVSGTLKVLANVWSPQLKNGRDVFALLPPSYGRGEWRYPVIYMHDAQNLFDAVTSFAGEEWQVDETMSALAHEGTEAIVVGLAHMGEQRMREYNPFADGERYLSWVVETVKPLVDRDFRTLAGRAHTGTLGSSLGGLISLYAFFRFADVFGMAGAMSPALWVQRGAIYPFVRQSPFAPGRIYLDNGTLEGNAQPMAALLTEKGYRPGHELRYVLEEGGKHRESAWARRLPDALRFLLG